MRPPTNCDAILTVSSRKSDAADNMNPSGRISLADIDTLDFSRSRQRRRFIAQASSTRGREPKESNFFVTINLNKSPQNRQQASQWQKAFAVTLQNLFLKRNTLESVLVFGPRDQQFAADNYSNDVDSVEANIGVEFGPQTLFLHAHILLSIRHRTQLQLDLNLIKQYIFQRVNRSVPELIGAPSEIYLNVKLMPETQYHDQMSIYVSKQSKQSNPQSSLPASQDFQEAEQIKQETQTSHVF